MSTQNAAVNSMQPSEQAMALVTWSRIWSPVVDEAMRADAWQALGLPASYQQHKSEYWTLFHAGDPQPLVPVVLHAALQKDGAATREDWMRVIDYLGLSWNDIHLSPDQLGAACEIYACAVERQEPVLIETLAQRYLLPWCDMAEQSLLARQSPLAALIPQFRRDVGLLG